MTARVLDGQAVAVHGPRGMGRTTFLDLVASGLPAAVVVRIARLGTPGHAAALIARAFDPSTLEELPERMRSTLPDPRPADWPDPAARLGDALTELLTAQAGHAPFVLVIDDVQYLDELSDHALRAAAVRSLGPGAFGLLLGVGPGDPSPVTGFVPTTSEARDLPVLHIDLPPFAGADTVEMLTEVGMATDTALWAHRGVRRQPRARPRDRRVGGRAAHREHLPRGARSRARAGPCPVGDRPDDPAPDRGHAPADGRRAHPAGW
uniref:ATP-binding protein n=1 Tax=Janibacter limosus TaxID=53458 RepID=A0AC61U5D5_9MICO|nr:ATP-binding protein [Janibacter limosus]